MRKIPSLFFVAKQEFFTFWSVFWIAVFSFFYLFLLIGILNYRLLVNELTFPLLFSLFLGLFTAFSPTDTLITLVSAVFVGINLFLMSRTIMSMKNQKSIRLSIGGATIIGIVSTGCSSCGFSVLSLIGLGSLFSVLPFKGLELHLLSLGLLLFSSWYMLKKLRDSLYCKR